MFRLSMTTVIAASALGTAAHADFVQFDGEYSVNSQGNNVVKMYAEFDDAQNVLLNMFDVVIEGDFIHSDVQIGAGGTWNPTASLDIPGFSDSENDSYVTAGYGVGAEAALNDGTFVAESVGQNLEQLQQLGSGLDELGLEWIPSVANFICARVGPNAAEIYEAMLKQGVIVRPVANYGLPEHLRISVGLEDENTRALAALDKARLRISGS